MRPALIARIFISDSLFMRPSTSSARGTLGRAGGTICCLRSLLLNARRIRLGSSSSEKHQADHDATDIDRGQTAIDDAAGAGVDRHRQRTECTGHGAGQDRAAGAGFSDMRIASSRLAPLCCAVRVRSTSRIA